MGFDLTTHNDTLKNEFIAERKHKAISLNALILQMRKTVAGKTVPRLKGS